MKKELNKVQKMILSISAVVVLGVIVGIYFFNVKPLLAEQDKVQESLAQKQKLLKAVEKRYDEEMNQYADKSTVHLQEQLPLNPNVEQIIFALNEIEEATDSNIFSYSLSEPQPFASEGEEEDFRDIMSLHLQLTVESPTYENMMSFVELLEQNERIFSVDNLSFNDPGPEGNYLLTLSLSTFYYEGIEGLQDEAPTFNIPEPSQKENPFQ
ncbi:hypothetical protein [Salirhabdus salicampi]|uniref:hypothetical protein n=1 Tax=Salirhabdus salicampi TaxID=476102 RepID=UPI0020C4C319|nr:hypothetical protein [Salirhabdus salicampi]MCP8617940.1 hypothetical protein [Salirhabdus salicampi]